MSIHVAINHKTHYKYDRLVSLSPHVFRLRPAPHSRTPIEAYSIKIRPENHFFNWQQDPFGNYQARVVFNEMATELYIEVEILADMKTINPFDFFVDESAKHFPFTYDDNLKAELAPYLEIRDNGDLLRKWLAEHEHIWKGKKDLVTIDFLVAVNMAINKHLNYTVRMEPGVQTSEQTLQRKLGSCRDFAWFMCQVLRHWGLATRFVSGYLVQLTADVKSLDGPSGPTNDFTDLHAWTEVYVPGAGWIGLDSTSGLFAAEGHIPLACTPLPESAAAVTGMTDVCETTFEYSNTVRRIVETPRVTKPYTDAQWNAINALGQKVDNELVAGDVRLTMGGEPTFVSVDDMDSPQWNIEADGEHKRKLANDLIFRLHKIFSKGGLLHYGQGKWYPGEPIPRWQYGLFWRKDEIPVWKNEKLIADVTKNYGYTHQHAQELSSKIAEYLGINPSNISTAYEDAFYYLWKEQQLPINVNPLEKNLKDSLERQNVAFVLDRGIDTPKGYVLPLKWSGTEWVTCKWQFRRKNLFLIPGNSAIGLRLPLDSLLYVPADKVEPFFERDTFAIRPELENYQDKVQRRVKQLHENKQKGIPLTEVDYSVGYKDFVRTAICIEEREGRLHIFMPPIEMVENYLDLVATIEAAAETLGYPVVIEGYEPPFDWRMERLKVTPDPGVIEVNIHPSKTWNELVERTEILYEQAHLSRLGSEKFMLDGRHTGTGGGNHVTLGGVTPADSPFLRRPDMLQSFVTYWQHHPALSFLFSTAFIGPTSQAPRVDEGRLENLYELEIAFSQLPEGGNLPFWIVDRLFRHHLTDITGNTHRAEFCIDKLYSPDSSSGRLGIVELRAFEMPPHARMSLVQALLVRTLVARFWKNPYQHDLVRWGSELYDKYLIEHYVRQDIQDIVEDLNRNGYAFDTAWFDPFFEFRFPHYGTVNIKGMSFELTMGIEPWHVLGEEVTASGTSRYVDSSVERVQLKTRDFNNTRYIIVCNGARVPLSHTGTKGEFVAAIRYKAWQPYSALHPTIGVDTPLIFDVVDTWNNKSIGGFNYFVSHPGGRSYATFPVNSYEAEARRGNRFWDFGHTPDTMTPVTTVSQSLGTGTRSVTVTNNETPYIANDELLISEEYPHTLDLRQSWRVRRKRN